MQTVIILPSTAVNFDSSNCTSPYLTAPSSPQHFTGFFHSAPTSPGRAGIPFTWEKEPGIPKSEDDQDEFQDTDFEFGFAAQLETSPLPAADQLFSGGKIRPLKPPPKFLYDHTRPLDSPKSPKSPKSPTRLLREALSPRCRNKAADFDPFTVALEKSRQRNSTRGRDAPRNKASRSLSPYRVSDLLFDDPDSNPPPPTSIFAAWYRKWRIKDLLLFRSASESRATDKPKRFARLGKSRPEDVRNSSFRSTDSGGSVSRRRSAHELHYAENRAVSEEMRKRTTLAYRQGLWGCLGFHPTAAEISRGITPSGSLSRQ